MAGQDDTVITLFAGGTKLAEGDQDNPDRISVVLGKGQYNLCLWNQTGTHSMYCSGPELTTDASVDVEVRFVPLHGSGDAVRFDREPDYSRSTPY